MRSTMTVLATASLWLVTAPSALTAQSAPTDTTPRITVGGFVDGYFAWDFGRPPAFDRSFAGGTAFTTQPARHNEFNVNLAFVELKLDAPNYRGRVALQTGTSVQSNYAGEPANGSISGPSLSRHIQEAVVGVRLAEKLWVDAGVFYSHVGVESWASRDNLTYTRSLAADYSPYYQSGAKLTWTPTAKITAQLNVINGWQNISENNSGKAAGVRIDAAASSRTTLSYYNLFSSEAGTRLRTFNGVGAKHSAGRLTLQGNIDVGTQDRGASAEGNSVWHTWSVIARVQASDRVAVVARAEQLVDRDQVIIATGSIGGSGTPTANPAFRAVGGSLGIDVSPYGRVLWRNEVRGWRNPEPLFPDGTIGAPQRTSVFVVSSLSLTF